MNKEAAIDNINLGLILVSFALALLLPFELFLVGYAVLGPLHYLTEVNWIRDKNYFVDNTYWKYLGLFISVLFAIPFIFSLESMQEIFNTKVVYGLRTILGSYTNFLVFLALLISILFLYIKNFKALFISVGVTLLMVFFVKDSTTFHLINGLFIPTIIHVYLFTMLFMIYGTRKKSSRIGVLNILLLIMLPLSLLFIDTDVFEYQFSDVVKNTYMENKFHHLNAYLAKLLGVYEDLKFFFYEKSDLKIQIFIAFAYCYHYLNWFSKTTVIGWHKKLTKKKSLLILIVWGAILSLYLYDYRLGFVLSIFISILHVVLEFPLNMITIKSLFNKSIN